MRLWLELAGALVALAFVWAVIETYFLGRTRLPSPRATPPHRSPDPRKYVDAARDNPPGEEGPTHYAVARPTTRPPKIARKRDGMSLSDEASAEVYRSVFGDDPPA